MTSVGPIPVLGININFQQVHQIELLYFNGAKTLCSPTLAFNFCPVEKDGLMFALNGMFQLLGIHQVIKNSLLTSTKKDRFLQIF